MAKMDVPRVQRASLWCGSRTTGGGHRPQASRSAMIAHGNLLIPNTALTSTIACYIHKILSQIAPHKTDIYILKSKEKF